VAAPSSGTRARWPPACDPASASAIRAPRRHHRAPRRPLRRRSAQRERLEPIVRAANEDVEKLNTSLARLNKKAKRAVKIARAKRIERQERQRAEWAKLEQERKEAEEREREGRRQQLLKQEQERKDRIAAAAVAETNRRIEAWTQAQALWCWFQSLLMSRGIFISSETMLQLREQYISEQERLRAEWEAWERKQSWWEWPDGSMRPYEPGGMPPMDTPPKPDQWICHQSQRL
jgi:hypothetical protein